MKTQTEINGTISGFKTKEQLDTFLDWFEVGMSSYMERLGVKYVRCQVQSHMIEHDDDGDEYIVDITALGEEDE